MNRRNFLKSLAAIEAAISIDPKAIASVPGAQIDTAWTTVLSEPATFFVSSCGALATTPGYGYPHWRREMYQFAVGDTADDLISLAGTEWRIDSVIRQMYEEAMADDGQDHSDEDWESWLRSADEDTFITVQMAVDKWLDEMGPEDYEHADLYGYSSRDEALSFFRNVSDTTDLFNIAIVEGDHPGSTYYAAELRMDVAEANALAEAKGIPIRFAHDMEWP